MPATALCYRVRSVGIEGHAVAEVVAEAPSGVARALLYCTIDSQGLSLFPSSSIIQVILPYPSSGYEPGSQGIFIEEAFYCILYSYDRLPRATTSLPPAKVGTTKCNVASLH